MYRTSATFLSDPSHRIRFVYTPRHCSWLNQVEIWCSILVRKLLKRASFNALDRVLAKPFKWTFTGRPLQEYTTIRTSAEHNQVVRPDQLQAAVFACSSACSLKCSANLTS